MLFQGQTMAFVSARDLDRAEAFYVGRLGLTRILRDDFALSVKGDDVRIRITRVPDLEPQPFTVLGWQVERIDEVVARLVQAGIEFRRYPGMEQDAAGIWRAPSGARVAWFEDPDGNVLSLSEHP
jgi:catechol 2,3-dioxygenase-like lactoylglutathione lyase family enzyme